jgi:hypothetical protein
MLPLLLACAEPEPEPEPAAPTVTISAPLEGDTIAVGEAVEIAGRVDDADSDEEDLVADWNDDPVSGRFTGVTTLIVVGGIDVSGTYNADTPGEVILSLTGRDEGALESTATVTVTVE